MFSEQEKRINSNTITRLIRVEKKSRKMISRCLEVSFLLARSHGSRSPFKGSVYINFDWNAWLLDI